MNASIIDIFENELKTKIILKMAPNLTEDQALIKYFKYFDLTNSGNCTLRDWIKTMDKVGVVLSKVCDMQEIFKYYDQDNTGSIEYKKFAVELFTSKRNIETAPKRGGIETNLKDGLSVITPKNDNSSSLKVDDSKRQATVFTRLHEFLRDRGIIGGLILFLKQFKLIDYNNSNRINIDNFIQVFTDSEIPLKVTELQQLFSSYEISNNGLCYYPQLFKQLKNVYHNVEREAFLEDFYQECYNRLNRALKVADLLKLFNASNHWLFTNKKASIQDIEDQFCEILDSFSYIKELAKADYHVSKADFIDFFGNYGFYLAENSEFIDMMKSLFNSSTSGANTPSKLQLEEKKDIVDKTDRTSQSEKEKMRDHVCLEKIKSSLKNFNLKSLFSFIKHYKYFDNGTKLINRFDFVKILKDYRLNLNINEIEKIFELFCVNSRDKEKLLNFEEFTLIICPPLNDTRRKVVTEAYNALKNVSSDITIDLVKSVYNARNHPTNKDEESALNMFIDSFELYYFSYKGYKNKVVSEGDFREFYRIFSFVISDDSLFTSILRSEWQKVLGNNVQENNQRVQEKAIPTISLQPKNIEARNVEKAESMKSFKQEEQQSLKHLRARRDENEDNEREIIPDNKSVHSVQKSVHSVQQSVTHSKKNNEELKKALQGIDSSKLTEHKYERSRPQSNIQTPKPQASAEDPLVKLRNKLKKRGLRGLLYLHKQFMVNCDLEKISLQDFTSVFNIQRLELNKQECQRLFQRFIKGNTEYLDFRTFMEQFKKALDGKRLDIVDRVFAGIEDETKNNVTLENVKLLFIPFLLRSEVDKRSEEDTLLDFFETFETNYNLFGNPDENTISYQEFANYYEYVSFLYENESDFLEKVRNSWETSA